MYLCVYVIVEVTDMRQRRLRKGKVKVDRKRKRERGRIDQVEEYLCFFMARTEGFIQFLLSSIVAKKESLIIF